ncbi:KAP family P-loop NTPase fold protein [Cronobacter dublinensis]|uniref:KAP family P-loop NTPase fold protein n=1 Tax=Cronobacter dublinensis TaxID=413497 RepID=UPI0024AF5E6B|nr:P-loop NTPase fold protein [Cronobacter dublinensis]MDI7386229.1 P-loop NTPase fold protein [Cronobacter dublinensis]
MVAGTELSRAGFEGPVIKAEDDRYGFSAIADGLARSICELDENISTVIGIEGKWGSGKTSLLNLLTARLRQMAPAATEIVPFSPWLISPDESPVTSLLLTIAGRLAQYETAAQADIRNVTTVTGTLVNYAQQTSRRLAPVARLAGKLGVPGFEIAADVMETLGETDLQQRQKTAAELREELENKITALGISFIIVIDDLDRLEPAQAVEILRMVRSVADFSRFRYVMCYDREVLAHAVERGLDVPDGRLYLQKIIPLSFALPRPESFTLRRQFRESALLIWREVSGREPDAYSERLLAHFVEVYGERLSTPREVNQALNAIRFRYHGLRDYVYFPDLCLLQLINTVNPEFAAWTEDYLTAWSVVVSLDDAVGEVETNELTARLFTALDKFGASRAASPWELHSWLPGITGFDRNTLQLFESQQPAEAEQATNQRRLRSSIYWRYYFSFSAPQNVMSDTDIQQIIELAASDYAALEARLLNSVTDNGISSRTWFEHILTRLTPGLTENSGDVVQRNLLTFFFRCTDRILPFYRERDLFYSREAIGIDPLVTQLIQQLLSGRRRETVRFISRLFRKAEAFAWAALYLRDFLPKRSAQGTNKTELFTAEETEQLRLALTTRLKETRIRKELSQVPYLSIFLAAWAELAGDEVVTEWASEISLTDRDFLQMLLNLRTAVSSSNRGQYLKLNLDHVNRFLGVSVRERFRDIKAKQIPALSGMTAEIEDAIQMNEEH